MRKKTDEQNSPGKPPSPKTAVPSRVAAMAPESDRLRAA